MKNTLLIIFLSTLSLALNPVVAQELAGKKNTFVTFDLLMSKDVLDKIDPYTPTATRGKENARDAKKYLEQVLLDKLHELTTAKLQEQSIEMQPMASLEDHKIMYMDMAIPIRSSQNRW